MIKEEIGKETLATERIEERNSLEVTNFSRFSQSSLTKRIATKSTGNRYPTKVVDLTTD